MAIHYTINKLSEGITITSVDSLFTSPIITSGSDWLIERMNANADYLPCTSKADHQSLFDGLCISTKKIQFSGESAQSSPASPELAVQGKATDLEITPYTADIDVIKEVERLLALSVGTEKSFYFDKVVGIQTKVSIFHGTYSVVYQSIQKLMRDYLITVVSTDLDTVLHEFMD